MRRPTLRGLAVAAVPLIATVFAAVVYLTLHRADRGVDDAAAAAAVAAARTGTEQLLSYAPDTVEQDMAAARSLTTGEFRTYYGRFADEVLVPAARDEGITATARVVDAAVSELGPEHAEVLVFLDTETAGRDRPEPARTAASVLVRLDRVDGRWLIAALEPL
ncbi:hypothetical protein [uncultured Mycolicibacterium sp.]|uniref:hypothetical protein n=1 Tax=uncultured Mycolicibacterium sp. TaxID=2320817 RepID=UPI00261D6A93|nr:hypothetical protein [uncultured Mycolicibacterium sp.]